MSGLRKLLAGVGLALLSVGVALAWQKEFREYPGQENIELPPDYKVQTDFVFGRLMYPPAGGRGGFRGFRGGNWKFGRSSWTTDYTAADRHVAVAMRRLTRVGIRSVEQPVDLDDGDDVMNWPWLYAVEVGQWGLTESQAKNLRDYLDRGGFLMVDDFHGEYEWEVFMESFKLVFPDKDVVELPDSDAIFHTIYDLSSRFQVPGAQYLRSGLTYERADGKDAHWRGIYDDKGRLMVAICHNMDLGDAWQYADWPEYDEKFAALSFRIVSNYIVYDLTH